MFILKNRRYYLVLVVLVALFITILTLFLGRHSVPKVATQSESATAQKEAKDSQAKTNSAPDFLPPLEESATRVTKKPFGLYVSSRNSPVSPERFQGYHTATDFEAFETELDLDVPVTAVCQGVLLLKDSAAGYGGFVVQSCHVDNEPITVIYGHLRLSSVKKSVGDPVATGETLGVLGKGYSPETDGERKHLHLGFHKGEGVNIRGYLPNKDGLSEWLDPCQYVCRN